MTTTNLVIPDALQGERLDKALSALVPTLSRAQAKRLIADGQVRVNGRRAAKGHELTAGDAIEIASDSDGPEGDESAAPTPDAPLQIVLERGDLLIVDKPAGMPTAPIRAGETGTLANALVGRYPELASIGYNAREPGLLHRLDTATSGLVLVARSASVFSTLRDALQDGRIHKRYRLICMSEGLSDRGTIEFPLTNHPKDRRRVYPCIHPRDVIRYAPRPARTTYTVIRRTAQYALVEATVSKALRHQIRAHFAAIEHPLIGDELYGGSNVLQGRHALHASLLEWEGSSEVPSARAEAPLPSDLEALLDGDATP